MERGTVCSSCEFFKLVKEEEGVFEFRLFMDREQQDEDSRQKPT